MVAVVARYGSGRVDFIDDRNRFFVTGVDAVLLSRAIESSVRVSDVASGGLCVITELALAAGDKCKVIIGDSDSDSQIFHAEVRWTKPTGDDMFAVGLQIVNGADTSQ